MAQVLIDRRKIDEVIRTMMQPLAQIQRSHNIHAVEIIIALAESLGRVIAVQEGSFVLHNELKDVALAHLLATLKTAYVAKGMNPEAIQV